MNWLAKSGASCSDESPYIFESEGQLKNFFFFLLHEKEEQGGRKEILYLYKVLPTRTLMLFYWGSDIQRTEGMLRERVHYVYLCMRRAMLEGKTEREGKFTHLTETGMQKVPVEPRAYFNEEF